MDLPEVHIYASRKKVYLQTRDTQPETPHSKDQIELIFLLPERTNYMKIKINRELSKVHTYAICISDNQGYHDTIRQDTPKSITQSKPRINFLLSESQNKIKIKDAIDIPSIHT